MTKNGYRITVVIAIIVITLITVTVIVGLELANIGPRSTPAVASILGFTAPTVAALFALLGVERVKRTQDGLNGKVDEAATKAAAAHATASETQSILKQIAERVEQGKL